MWLTGRKARPFLRKRLHQIPQLFDILKATLSLHFRLHLREFGELVGADRLASAQLFHDVGVLFMPGKSGYRTSCIPGLHFSGYRVYQDLHYRFQGPTIGPVRTGSCGLLVLSGFTSVNVLIVAFGLC